MGNSSPVLCPECGWTGTQGALDVEDEQYLCPLCSFVFNIDP